MKSPKILFAALVCAGCAAACTDTGCVLSSVDRPDTGSRNVSYVSGREPLLPQSFIKLPVGSVRPEGWVRRYLELQRDGLTGHLGEISAWLDKEDNAWLSPGGSRGWEEVPYWLKGYGDMAYILGDEDMIEETMVWIEGVLDSRRDDGFFGPASIRNGKPELWGQMIMLWCLQSYYEYSGDGRVIDLMTDFFRWELGLPDEMFLEDYWEKCRGGDNLLSVLWLYERTGEDFLLELAEKIHRNTIDWDRVGTLPDWHNVNIAEGFREPAQYYLLAGDSTMLAASYNVHSLVRRAFGQVPGGMFGADENARMGYIDPRQGVETCGMVEQMASDEIMLRITGDPFWAEHCEEVAFNSYPAAVMPDFRALRYITCPNHTISDAKDYHPAIENRGPYLAMNPFSSRCCQHNHAFGWPYFAENLILATQDNGVAAAIYSACTANVMVADGKEIVLREETRYPFEEDILFTVETSGDVRFPFYLRIPSWTENASVKVNGKSVGAVPVAGRYFRIDRLWQDGDRVSVTFPMSLTMRRWQANRGSVSVDYGPLTLSLKIGEKYVERNSTETVIFDAGWQEDADPTQWPTTEIYPEGDWNYALSLPDGEKSLDDIEIVRKEWPEDDFPFSLDGVPLEFRATGRKVPSWGPDPTGLCGVLPPENAAVGEREPITLVPMGAARLRISAFPYSE